MKRVRKHALIQEHELFIMQPGETIPNVLKRFTYIVNHLIGLGKIFDKEELNTKILMCLDRTWQLKVTAIFETRDLSTSSTTTLSEKLKELELEMNRLKEQEMETEKLGD